MDLEELVNQKYDALTANDREMAAAIFRDRNLVREMNSSSLASFLHVSRTTLVRFLKKLGVGSFAEFKLLLERKEEKQGTDFYDLGDIVQEYHAMVEAQKKHDYGKICAALYRAGTIYVYGTGNEQKSIAEEFKRIFLTLGKCCIDLFDLGEVQAARGRFREDDVFLAISLSGENPDAAEVVRAAQAAGVKTMALTRWENNTLARMTQENLYVGTKTVSHCLGQPYEMVAAFYILLDILSVRYLEYIEKRKEEGVDEG